MVEDASTLEEVETEHIAPKLALHMPKAAMLSATWKIVVEHFSLVLHVLHKPPNQIPSYQIVSIFRIF
jgi:hypothetical protein